MAIDPLDGFTGDVSLAVTSEPPFPGSIFLDRVVVTPPDFTFLEIRTDCETQTGDYAVTVTGTSADGATASDGASITVEFESPLVGFSFSREDFTFQFVDFSFTRGCAQIVEWAWDFGDGTTSSEQNPIHTYAARGDYPVTLTVTTDRGRSASTSQIVRALPPPPVLSIFRITRDPARFEFRVDLRWSGAEGDLVELHRNGSVVDLPDNDGVHLDRFRSLETQFDWQICELGIDFCSNTVSVSLGQGQQADQATVIAEIDGERIVDRIAIEKEDLSPAAESRM